MDAVAGRVCLCIFTFLLQSAQLRRATIESIHTPAMLVGQWVTPISLAIVPRAVATSVQSANTIRHFDSTKVPLGNL